MFKQADALKEKPPSPITSGDGNCNSRLSQQRFGRARINDANRDVHYRGVRFHIARGGFSDGRGRVATYAPPKES